MGDEHGDGEREAAEEGATLPDLRTWSQAGWIFRDGDCVAIERRGGESDRCSRVLAD
jgi:hypothetical protein